MSVEKESQCGIISWPIPVTWTAAPPTYFCVQVFYSYDLETQFYSDLDLSNIHLKPTRSPVRQDQQDQGDSWTDMSEYLLPPFVNLKKRNNFMNKIMNVLISDVKVTMYLLLTVVSWRDKRWASCDWLVVVSYNVDAIFPRCQNSLKHYKHHFYIKF